MCRVGSVARPDPAAGFASLDRRAEKMEGTMNQSEVRELLDEHVRLRQMIAEMRAHALSWAHGAPAKQALKAVLLDLEVAVREHNEHEEATLRSVIGTIDAWGPERSEVMVESHLQEHAEVLRAIHAATNEKDPKVAAKRIAALGEAMASHMDREEQLFLREDLLSGELPAIDGFGG
jgi:hypothetical protein